MVEPHPGNFNKLKNLRSSLSYFENAACVGFEFTGLEMQLSYSNLMTVPLQGDSDIENRILHAESGRRFLKQNEKVHTFVAKARTLSSILDEVGAPRRIDLLSLDVEGGEIEVLNGIDHNKYQFKWILVESRDEARIVEYLGSLGYKLHSKMTSLDYLFEFESC